VNQEFEKLPHYDSGGHKVAKFIDGVFLATILEKASNKKGWGIAGFQMRASSEPLVRPPKLMTKMGACLGAILPK
jgi:hypothetical protein